MKLAPALASGCSIVIKPSEETPLTTIRIVALLQQAGVPEGVVNVITGYGHTTGAALVEHPLVRKVSFTGSGEVGKSIVRAAAGNLKRVTLELGGKSPVLIFDDADIKRASAAAAWGIFTNTGQACVAGSRIFAEAKVYDQVVEGISKVAKRMKIGNGIEKDTVLGPVISQRQMDRILGYIDGGRREGAEVITGGSRIGDLGYFIEPTVMVNARPEMSISREEIFGPVVTVTKFDDADAAIAEANDTEYGLSASVWTRDLSRAHQLASRLQAGTVAINSGHMNDFNMPFGGYKQSGWGRENGAEGISAFLESKSVFAALE
jgi:aldehyde dehydrogenase (NAD+)